MPVPPRLRRLLAAALPALLAVLITACSDAAYPNSVFTRHTEFNRDIGYLFKVLIWLGSIVFVFVEGILLYTIFRFRRRSENERPEHVHGNTTLEILWTIIPALILAFIAVPTVQTIFKTQAKAKSDALQVEVIGHQWWWEFRYPQYKITTANELYLPVGRTVNFALRTQDVLHSFWIPQMGGKRDLISNHTNYLWFTPDSVGEQAWNGTCAEYCGASHANMHFRMFSVSPANFEAWAAHQQTPAAFGAVAPASAAKVDSALRSNPTQSAAQQAQIASMGTTTTGPAGTVAAPNQPVGGTGAPTPAHDMSAMAGMNVSTGAGATVQQAGYVSFPRERIPVHVVPHTPIPSGLAYNEAVHGDPERGRDMLTKGAGGCLGCHMISGNPSMMGVVGPNLTHVGSRSTIAGGIYPNDTKHLALWIKNSRRMKPGVIMPTLGAGQYDPTMKITVPKTGLSDEQIADIVAYLQALK